MEALHCRPIVKPRQQYRDLRSTRFIDFRPNRDTHPDLSLSAHAVADRYVLRRQILKDIAPDPAASTKFNCGSAFAGLVCPPLWSAQLARRLREANWQGNRGSAGAALNRSRTILRKFGWQLRKGRRNLERGATYHLVIYFVVDQSVWRSNPAGRESIHKAFAEFVSALNARHGIDVNQDLSAVVPGDEFTWQDTKITDEWNFANLSHSES